MADTTVGIIGAGQMGSGIAHVFAISGYRVLLNDVAQDRIEAGMTTVPMLILARKESSEDHQIHWITDMSSIRELPNTKHCRS